MLGAIYKALAFLPVVTTVQASPQHGLARRDLTINQDCSHSLLLGNDGTNLGPVCISLSDGFVDIDFPALTGSQYDDVKVYVGTTAPTDPPGQFPYGSPPKTGCTITGGGTDASCHIPVQTGWRACTGDLWFAIHADVVGTKSGTAWGSGECYNKGGGNCWKRFTLPRSCFCPVVTTFTPIETSTTCTITITTESVKKTTITPSPITTSATCDDPNPGTKTTSGSTTTSVNWECPTTGTCPAPTT